MPLAVIVPDAPQDGSQTGQPIPRWMLNTSVASVLSSAAIYALIYVSGAGFENLFKGFGADLPVLTRVVMASYKWYGILLLVGVVPSLYLFKNRTSYTGNRNYLFAPVLASFGVAILLMGITTVAAYLPIFQLGSAVQ